MNRPKLLTKNQLKILKIAKEYAKKSYKETVTSMATVLLTKTDNIYTGINVKYKNIWKCICAERVAIAKALEAGDAVFDCIVTVKYYPETDRHTVVNMCGECRQIAICHRPFLVIVNDQKTVKAVSIEQILPYSYI